MIVIDSRPHIAVVGSGAAREAVLQQLAAQGVQLSASAPELARDLTAKRVAGVQVAPSGVHVDLAMQDAGEAIEATTDDLRTINARHAGQELAAEDVVVFQDYALSSARMNDRPIQFTRAALERLADEFSAGRSVCLGHNHDHVIGATFAADVVDETVRGVEASWLRIRWYGVLTDQTSEARRQTLQDCRTGVLRFGSVGVWGGAWEFVELEGPDGPEFFYLIDASDDLMGREYSRVYFGASTGAGDSKFSAAPTTGAPAPTPSTPASPPSREGGAVTPQVLCVL